MPVVFGEDYNLWCSSSCSYLRSFGSQYSPQHCARDQVWGPPSYTVDIGGKAVGSWSWPLTSSLCWAIPLYLVRIWGTHSGGYEEFHLLRYYAVWTNNQCVLPVFLSDFKTEDGSDMFRLNVVWLLTDYTKKLGAYRQQDDVISLHLFKNKANKLDKRVATFRRY
jgi:hypothetical protein